MNRDPLKCGSWPSVSDETRLAERNGKRLDTECCIVFEVENGRVTSGREHFFDLYNWDEFWS